MHKKKWRKAALALSACLFVLWWALGAGATLAWFSDTDTVRNEFQVGLLKLDVSNKNDIVTEYTPLEGSTEVFCDEALYEPGYTQVVYLKIENDCDSITRELTIGDESVNISFLYLGCNLRQLIPLGANVF